MVRTKLSCKELSIQLPRQISGNVQCGLGMRLVGSECGLGMRLVGSECGLGMRLVGSGCGGQV